SVRSIRYPQTILKTSGTPVRVLHVVESLDRGAVENWLLRMLGHAEESGVKLNWTFYCTLGQPGLMEERARQLGARVVHSPVPLTRKREFIRALRWELQRGKHDILHCHHDLVSAIYLVASLGIPLKRIVHVHNADETIPTSSLLKRNVFRAPMRHVCFLL